MSPYDYDMISIGGWTFSLKNGKKLNVYDVAKNKSSVVKKKLTTKLNWLDNYQEDIGGYDYSKMPFFLKQGKVYAYANNYVFGYRYPAIPAAPYPVSLGTGFFVQRKTEAALPSFLL